MIVAAGGVYSFRGWADDIYFWHGDLAHASQSKWQHNPCGASAIDEFSASTTSVPPGTGEAGAGRDRAQVISSVNEKSRNRSSASPTKLLARLPKKRSASTN